MLESRDYAGLNKNNTLISNLNHFEKDIIFEESEEYLPNEDTFVDKKPEEGYSSSSFNLKQ